MSEPRGLMGASARRARDEAANYNTPLSPQQEAAFLLWVQQTGRTADLADYDLRGAWKADAKTAGNGHLPDTWKKPNHPTFSAESIYSSPYTPGGAWSQLPGGRWRFTAGPQNLRTRSADDLKAYFDRVEPGNELVLPAR